MKGTNTSPSVSVLSPDDPDPLEIANGEGNSQFFLVCEHAGNHIPASLGNLGLSSAELEQHIAWDIGARELTLELARLLDAPLYMQRYSRLVCDCNRQPDSDSFTAVKSESITIPGNNRLSAAHREARAREIFWPFHNAVTAALDIRQQRGVITNLVTIHSFTPRFLGQSRPWEIGVLYNRDRQFAPAIANWLQENTRYCIGVNEPYSVAGDTDYAIPVHGEMRGLPCVEFEIRNDLIADSGNAPRWAQVLYDALHAVVPSG